MEFGNPQTLNAKIKFSFLGITENGDLDLQLGFETQGNCVFKSNFTLANELVIADILNTLKVRSWEELPRKFARIKISNGVVVAIGDLIEDIWVNL